MVDFDSAMDINVRGLIDLLRQVLPHFSSVKSAEVDGEQGVFAPVSSSAAFDG